MPELEPKSKLVLLYLNLKMYVPFLNCFPKNMQ